MKKQATSLCTASVFISAERVEELPGGLFRVELRVAEIDPGTHKVLQDLFPNLLDRVYTVLGQEALLASVIPVPTMEQPDPYDGKTTKAAY